MKSVFTIIAFLISLQFVVGQDSLNMTKLANIGGMGGTPYNDIWGYTDPNGVEYAILGSKGAINIINIADHQNPFLDTFYIDGSNTSWRDFKTYQNFVYAICDNCSSEGLEVIDMNTRTFTQNNTHFNQAHNIYIEETTGRLYAVGVNGVTDLIIYDIATDPANPIHLNSIDFGSGNPNYIHDIYVKDSIAYASHGYSGYSIYNVADPNNIIELGTYTNSTAYNHSSWKDPNSEYSYVAYEVPTGVPIDIFKIDANYNVQKKGDFSQPNIPNAPTLNTPHNPFIKGDSLYISYYHDGIQVWDISEKEDPKLVSHYDTYPINTNYNGYSGCWGIYPFFESGAIVASDRSTGLYIFKPLPPQVNIGSADLVIDDSEAGVVLKDSTGNYHKMQVDADGNLIINPYAPTGVETTQLINSDLVLNNTSNGLILRSPLDKHYKVMLDNNFNFYTQAVSLPTIKIVENSDVMFNSTNTGLYIHSDNNIKVRLGVNNSGVLMAYPWPF